MTGFRRMRWILSGTLLREYKPKRRLIKIRSFCFFCKTFLKNIVYTVFYTFAPTTHRYDLYAELLVSISDIKGDEKSLIGQFAEKIQENDLDEAKIFFEQITENQNEKQKFGLFKLMFRRVSPEKYTQLIQVMWPNLSEHSFKSMLMVLDQGRK